MTAGHLPAAGAWAGSWQELDSSKARDLLGWAETEPHEAVHRSVAWHLAHPPEDASEDFADDDRALAAAG